MDQMRLADGTLINTEDGKRTVSTEINQTFDEADRMHSGQPLEFVTGKRRFLDDLPMPFLQSKPVAIIASYTMFGLTAGDISRVLNVPRSEIEAIRETTDYTDYMNSVMQNVREHDQNKVRKRLNKHADKAAKTIVNLMTESMDDKVRLAASKDILDRTGHKPSDVTEHKHSMDGGITIRVIKDKPVKEIELEAFDG